MSSPSKPPRFICIWELFYRFNRLDLYARSQVGDVRRVIRDDHDPSPRISSQREHAA